jgi:hypothetical protein
MAKMSEPAPSILKGAARRQRDNGLFWLEIFTHFTEEVNYKEVDFKIFSPISKKLGEEIESRIKRKVS